MRLGPPDVVAVEDPVFDSATEKVRTAQVVAQSGVRTGRLHQCRCGFSTSGPPSFGPDGSELHPLALHVVCFHRSAVSEPDLAAINSWPAPKMTRVAQYYKRHSRSEVRPVPRFAAK